MLVRTLDDLRKADDVTLRFTPLGFSTSGGLRPEDAAAYLQGLVAGSELAPRVAEGTRRSFDDLREVFPLGLFNYTVFTLVRDHALVSFEQALRDRFLEHHAGTITFVDDPADLREDVVVATFDDVKAAADRKRRDRRTMPDGRKSSWQLAVTDAVSIPFNGMLHGLREWAWQLGLLRGQRNRTIENALTELRNLAAHPNGHHRDTPVSAAGMVADLAEIINQLWGVPTPGGRLYPAPVQRDVTVLAWNGAGRQVYRADLLAGELHPSDRDRRCLILRSPFAPQRQGSFADLHSFDSRYETTAHPIDLLWGPGPVDEAAAWYRQHRPEPDTYDAVERLFAVRHVDGQLYRPMRPAVAAALPDHERTGRWYCVKADVPDGAFTHVYSVIVGTGCQVHGRCPACHATSLACGDHQEVMAALIDPATPAQPLPPDFATEWAGPRARPVP
ncbi:hypothetical protein [Pseudofrankia sp. DC12]|uniref:hypothetical protein n=1 Tax=Pseudofrankia sp. DC12 TaxID=683315 RepID=UPI000696A730|nr:hypothetical protein [Pseudofrankia sp. DC12]